MIPTFHAVANTLHFSPVSYHVTDYLPSCFTSVFATVPVAEVSKVVVSKLTLEVLALQI